MNLKASMVGHSYDQITQEAEVKVLPQVQNQYGLQSMVKPSSAW